MGLVKSDDVGLVFFAVCCDDLDGICTLDDVIICSDITVTGKYHAAACALPDTLSEETACRHDFCLDFNHTGFQKVDDIRKGSVFRHHRGRISRLHGLVDHGGLFSKVFAVYVGAAKSADQREKNAQQREPHSASTAFLFLRFCGSLFCEILRIDRLRCCLRGTVVLVCIIVGIRISVDAGVVIIVGTMCLRLVLRLGSTDGGIS